MAIRYPVGTRLLARRLLALSAVTALAAVSCTGTSSPPVPGTARSPPAGTMLARWGPAGNTRLRIAEFRRLHSSGCFAMPNPWDVGSARYLQHLGFPALATTSAGFAFSQGLPDSGDSVVDSRDRTLAHIASIAAAVDLPVSADFMSGYGLEPEDVAESVARCVATGVAGLSIEDASGDPMSPLYDLPIAIERIRAARQAIDRSGDDVLLTARAECYHVGHPDPFRESVRRLETYAAAGADVLFAPGPQNPAEIRALVEAVAPKPVNLLVVRDIGLRVEEIAALGVRRISVGGTMARVAMHAFIQSARQIKQDGKFDSFAGVVTNAELNKFFHDDLQRRPKS